MKRLARVLIVACPTTFFAAGLLFAQARGVGAPASVEPDPPCFDNASRYVDCRNGTVTDTVTGLVWLQHATCFGRVDWASGNTLAVGLAHGQCGLTDGSRPGHWRLPTLQEWQATIAQAVAMGCTLEGTHDPPALTNNDGTACLDEGPTSFSRVNSGGYWSVTTHEQHPNNAWTVSLVGTIHGFVFSSVKHFALPVWPVRGGS